MALEGYKLFHAGTLALSRVEQNGFLIDIDYCQKKSKEMHEEEMQVRADIDKDPFFKDWKKAHPRDFNITSDTQLAWYLFDFMGLKAKKETTSGASSTDEESLASLHNPSINKIIRVRKLNKARGTYLGNFLKEQVDGVVHTNYNLHIARTYRSSSSDPNLQNIPIRIPEIGGIVRKAVIPRPRHKIIEVDYGGIEVCISACYNKDPNLLTYINDPTTDMHRDMGQQIYILGDDEWNKPIRGQAKNKYVFPAFYGSFWGNTAPALWEAIEELGLKTNQGVCLYEHLRNHGMRCYEEFERHIEKIDDHFWNVRFKVYKKWKDDQYKKYQKLGYITTKTGFRCSGVMNRKEVSNYPIQGSAFHCLLWSLIHIDELIQKKALKSMIIGQIHDSMILDVVPEEEEFLLKHINRISTQVIRKYWPWIIVPLKIEAEATEIDEPWYFKKAIELP